MALNKFLLNNWSEAERRAAEAERMLFEKTLNARGPQDFPSQQEIDSARSLRLEAIDLVHQVIEELNATAEEIALQTRSAGAQSSGGRHRRSAEGAGTGGTSAPTGRSAPGRGDGTLEA